MSTSHPTPALGLPRVAVLGGGLEARLCAARLAGLRCEVHLFGEIPEPPSLCHYRVLRVEPTEPSDGTRTLPECSAELPLRWTPASRELSAAGRRHALGSVQELLLCPFLSRKGRLRLLRGLLRQKPPSDPLGAGKLFPRLEAHYGGEATHGLLGPYLHKRFGWGKLLLPGEAAPLLARPFLPSREALLGLSSDAVGVVPGGLGLIERQLAARLPEAGVVLRPEPLPDNCLLDRPAEVTLVWRSVHGVCLNEERFDLVVSWLDEAAFRHLAPDLPAQDLAPSGVEFSTRLEVLFELAWGPVKPLLSYDLDLNQPFAEIWDYSRLDPSTNHSRSLVGLVGYGAPYSRWLHESDSLLIDRALRQMAVNFPEFRAAHLRDAWVDRRPAYEAITAPAHTSRNGGLRTAHLRLLNASHSRYTASGVAPHGAAGLTRSVERVTELVQALLGEGHTCRPESPLPPRTVRPRGVLEQLNLLLQTVRP